MDNLINFDLALPIHGKMTEVAPLVRESATERKIASGYASLIQVEPLSTTAADGLTGASTSTSTFGLVFVDLKLKPNSCYELLLIGCVIPAAGVQPTDINLSLLDGIATDHVVKRIQDPDGYTINLLLRFNTPTTCTIAGESKKKVESKLTITALHAAPRVAPHAEGKCQKLLFDHRKCYLKQIRTGTNVCLRRRGELKSTVTRFSSGIPTDYSLLQTMFDKIYVLNLDHQPHRWIQCQKRLEEVSVRATRLGYTESKTLHPTRSSESKTLHPAGSSTASIADMRGGIVHESVRTQDEAIVSILGSEAKTLGLERVLFLQDNCIFDLNFEHVLYQSMIHNDPTGGADSSIEGKGEDKGIEGKREDKGKSLMIGPGAMGIGRKHYTEIVSRFSAARSVGAVSRIVESLRSDNPSDCRSLPGIRLPTSGSPLGRLDARTLMVDPQHYVGIFVIVPRKEFYIDSSRLHKLVQEIVAQEYPYWWCTIVTSSLPLSRAGGVTAADLEFYRCQLKNQCAEEERFTIVEIASLTGQVERIAVEIASLTSQGRRSIQVAIDDTRFADPTYLGRLVFKK